MKSQTSGDDPEPSLQKHKKKKKIPLLHALLTIYGILYVVFITDTFISSDKYDLYNPENIVVNLAFVLFLVGYYMAWQNEGVAGIIFLLWWVLMWVLALFIMKCICGIQLFIDQS